MSDTDQPANAEEGKPLKLKLYIAGETPKSMAAIRNLQKICADNLGAGRYEIEVIDLRKQPQLAREYNIVAIPTLVRQLPVPIQKIIGDLSDTQKVLVSLQIEPAG